MPELGHLLQPFLSHPLSRAQAGQVQTYLDLLLKWNAKINLTAIRDPNEIVQRHFGESFFAAEHAGVASAFNLIDVGSGAGFPGLPAAILAPGSQVTLIESQQKKVAFLREVVRTLELKNVNVHLGRAEESSLKAEIVTLRAVERFGAVLPAAASLVKLHGKLALLAGNSQTKTAYEALPQFAWFDPICVPLSRERVLLIAKSAD